LYVAIEYISRSIPQYSVRVYPMPRRGNKSTSL
jgi:hypothetical protein